MVSLIPQPFGHNSNDLPAIRMNQDIPSITINRDRGDVTGTSDKHYVIFTDGVISIKILFEDKTLWFSCINLQTIFGIKVRSGINKRIKQFYSENKLDESITSREKPKRAKYYNMPVFSRLAIYFKFKDRDKFENAFKNYENMHVENVSSTDNSCEPSRVVLEPIGLEECSMRTPLNISNGELIINIPSEIEENRESTRIIEQEANFPSEIPFESPHQQGLENTSNNSWNDNDFLADEMNRDIVGATSGKDNMIPSFIYNSIEFLKETSIISNLVFNSDNLQFSNFLLSLGKYDKRQLALFTIFGHEDFRKSKVLVTPKGLNQHGGKPINEKDYYKSVRDFAKNILIPNKEVLEYQIVDEDNELVKNYLAQLCAMNNSTVKTKKGGYEKKWYTMSGDSYVDALFMMKTPEAIDIKRFYKNSLDCLVIFNKNVKEIEDALRNQQFHEKLEALRVTSEQREHRRIKELENKHAEELEAITQKNKKEKQQIIKALEFKAKSPGMRENNMYAYIMTCDSNRKKHLYKLGVTEKLDPRLCTYRSGCDVNNLPYYLTHRKVYDGKNFFERLMRMMIPEFYQDETHEMIEFEDEELLLEYFDRTCDYFDASFNVNGLMLKKMTSILTQGDIDDFEFTIDNFNDYRNKGSLPEMYINSEAIKIEKPKDIHEYLQMLKYNMLNENSFMIEMKGSWKVIATSDVYIKHCIEIDAPYLSLKSVLNPDKYSNNEIGIVNITELIERLNLGGVLQDVTGKDEKFTRPSDIITENIRLFLIEHYSLLRSTTKIGNVFSVVQQALRSALLEVMKVNHVPKIKCIDRENYKKYGLNPFVD